MVRAAPSVAATMPIGPVSFMKARPTPVTGSASAHAAQSRSGSESGPAPPFTSAMICVTRGEVMATAADAANLDHH